MQEIRIEANGVGFAALTWGDPDAPLALLVHGYPDTAHTWRHLGPELAARGWRAVAPFTRGYGPTDLAPDDDYSVAVLAADVLALRRALGGGQVSVLVGHDWGAAAAYAATTLAPDAFARVAALAVPPPHALVRPFTSARRLTLGLRQARMSWYMLFNQLPRLSEHALDRLIPRLWSDWSPGYDSRADVARVMAALEGAGRRRAALRYYRASLAPRNLASTFTGTAGTAVLYLHGERDGCIHAQVGALATLPAGSERAVVPHVGHFLHLEAPDHVNSRIADWLDASGRCHHRDRSLPMP